MLGKIALILVLWVFSLLIELGLVNLFLRFYNYFGFNLINTKYQWTIDIIHFILLVSPLIIIIKLVL